MVDSLMPIWLLWSASGVAGSSDDMATPAAVSRVGDFVQRVECISVGPATGRIEVPQSEYFWIQVVELVVVRHLDNVR